MMVGYRRLAKKRMTTGFNTKQNKPGGCCFSAACRVEKKRSEKYKQLNTELTKEVANLRLADKSNREYTIMFDRFLLKFGQSVPRLQSMKTFMEKAYDRLLELETMFECFSDAECLRAFLVGENSFNFGGGDDIPSSPKSPLVKEAPCRSHRRFDEEGEIHTIVEEPEASIDENIAPADNNVLQVPEITRNGVSISVDDRELPRRRSSRQSGRRSSVGIARRSEQVTFRKSANISLSSCVMNIDSDKHNSDSSGSESTMKERQNHASSTLGEASSNHQPVTSRRSLSDRQMEYLDPETNLSISPINRNTMQRSPMRRATYVKRIASPMDITMGSTGISTFNDSSLPVVGKSDEDFSRCFENTEVQPEADGDVVPAQVNERSPTAINVAQVWAAANAMQPPERSPTCTNVAAAYRAALVEESVASPKEPSFTAPLQTTLFPSPVVQKHSNLPKGSQQPTSTPAHRLQQSTNCPTPPQVSLIVAEENLTPELPREVPENVVCRRRKRISVAGSPMRSALTSNKTEKLRKSVRFSGVLNDISKTSPGNSSIVAAISSPLVKNKNRPTGRRTITIKKATEDHFETTDDEADDTITNAENHAIASRGAAKTTQRKNTSAKSAVRKTKTVRCSALVQDTIVVSPRGDSETFVASGATFTVDPGEAPLAKRPRADPPTAEVPKNHGNQARSSSDSLGTSADSLGSSRRSSRRVGSISYAEPSLKHKIRRK